MKEVTFRTEGEQHILVHKGIDLASYFGDLPFGVARSTETSTKENGGESQICHSLSKTQNLQLPAASMRRGWAGT